MADKIEQADIRGLDIDKAVKGFALIEYNFKNFCAKATTNSDTLRWYQETSADLEATSPANIEKMPLSTPANLEVSWTRNTSYIREFMAEVSISEMDYKTADIDVLARQLLRLTRAVMKKVDTRIYNVATENLTPSNIQTFATTAIGGDQWDAASYAGNPIKDILHARQLVETQGYRGDFKLILHPVDVRNLTDWLIAGKGSSIPAFASDQVRTGAVMNILGVEIISSPNATQDYGLFVVDQQAVTWKSHTPITSTTIVDEGLSRKIRVWERGEAILTDPKAVVLITDLQS